MGAVISTAGYFVYGGTICNHHYTPVTVLKLGQVIL